MKVNLGTIEVSDFTRRALRADQGRSGLATREEVRSAFLTFASAVIQDKVSELQQALDGGEVRRGRWSGDE